MLRDCKITQIYEGTNGIQAMDLLGRKLGLNKGRAFTDLLAEVQKTVDAARQIETLAPLAEMMDAAVIKLMETAKALGTVMGAKKIEAAFAQAHPFLDVTGDTLMGWMLLWRAVIATRKLADKPKKKDVSFYEGQLKSAQFFIHSVLPVARGKMEVIMAGDTAALDISEEAFGSK